MSTTKEEKICSFFASDYHFEMISLPYIQKSLEDEKEVIIFTENDLSGTINKLISRMNLDKKMEDKIFDVMVPTVVDKDKRDKKGNKAPSEHKFFPGYILVKMIMTDNAWHLIKDNPNVTNFLGSRNKPYPITEAEVQRIITQMQEGIKSPESTVEFEIGEQVRVCDGPFASFVGSIEEIDTEKSRVKVSVSIFGRATPVELEYSQVEKV